MINSKSRDEVLTKLNILTRCTGSPRQRSKAMELSSLVEAVTANFVVSMVWFAASTLVGGNLKELHRLLDGSYRRFSFPEPLPFREVGILRVCDVKG